jgi:hypothetical protein
MTTTAIIILALIPFAGWFALGLCVGASRGEGNYGDAQ